MALPRNITSIQNNPDLKYPLHFKRSNIKTILVQNKTTTSLDFRFYPISLSRKESKVILQVVLSFGDVSNRDWQRARENYRYIFSCSEQMYFYFYINVK
jgi:hypothetical protein